MKVVIYEYEKIKKAGQLLDSVNVSGTSNFRALSELSDILESGQTGNYTPNKEANTDDGSRTLDNQSEGNVE